MEETACGICSKQVSKYKCPRCFIGYCSLACYKSKEHEKCSENFFKENVMDEIKGMKASDQEKKKMMDILDQYNRYDENEEEDDDETEEEENDLSRRLEGVNLENFNDVWERLNEEERKQFEEKIQREDVGELIEVWKPWWLSYKVPIIEDLTKPQEVLDPSIPSILENIPLLTTLTKISPPFELCFNLIEFLFCYCYTCRYFNGEPQVEASSVILSLSNILSSNEKYSYEDANLAIMTMIQKATHDPKFRNPIEFLIGIIEDLTIIFSHKKMILMSLSDLYRILSLKSSKKVVLAQRKVYFYLSWSNELSNLTMEMLHGTLKTILQNEKEKLAQYSDEKKIVEETLERKKDGKSKLIVELN